MKCLCIYVTYDFENIVDKYIESMLRELRKLTNCLVVVCNYEKITSGIEYIQPMQIKYTTGKMLVLMQVLIKMRFVLTLGGMRYVSMMSFGLLMIHFMVQYIHLMI